MKYGIIGCGNISRFHFGALEKIDAEITYVADINMDAARQKAEKYGARVTDDYNELIASKEVEVVCILAASGIHRDAALKSIAAGKGVICEKTMMNNAQDAYGVAKAAKEAGTVFFTSYMKRFFPAARKMKELTTQIGTVFSANVRTYQCWGNLYAPGHGWDLDAVVKGYGGAIIKCAASHMLDMTVFLLGRPAGVFADIDYCPNSNFDRRATALFQYDGPLAVTFEAAAHPLEKIGYERNSWDEFIEINGTEGRLKFYTVMWDHPENNGALIEYYDNRTGAQTEYRFDAMNPFDAQIAYFNECFENSEHGSPSETDGYVVDELIDSIYRANREKKMIGINWKI